MYRIGLFSKLARTTIKTLRHYDEIGLLRPARVDEWTGYRYYATEQLFRLNEILSLRQAGFSLSEIEGIMSGRDMSDTLARKKTELEHEVRDASERLSRLTNYIKTQKESIIMSYNAVIKEIPECTVYSCRTVLPTYDSLMSVMPALGEKLRGLYPALQCAEPDYCFNVYPEPEYKEKDIEVEICQAVTRAFPDKEGITFKKMPAVKVVSVLHRGAYENLGEAYSFGLKWLADNGYKLDGEPRESFIDGIWNKESEDDWLTEIQLPIG